MDEPRWLDSHEERVWRSMLVILERLPSSIDTQLKRDVGITRFEYNVLSMLSMSPDDTAPMSSLAFLTNGSMSRLSHAVTKLEERGWMRRSPSATDRRSLLATLTPEGRRLLEQAAPAHVEQVRTSLFDAIPPERMRELGELLEPVARALLGPGDPQLPD